MTLMHIPPDEAVTAAAARHEFVVALTDAAAFLAAHVGAELPDGLTLSKRVRGLTYGDRLAELTRIAESWDVDVETRRDGTRLARRTFGPLTLAAAVSPPDASLTGYYARIGAAA